MRRVYAYEFDICGLDVEGTYWADCGQLDIVALPDGTEVAVDFDGTARDAGQGPEALALAKLIAKRIMGNVVCQNEMDQTRHWEPWASHAPVVL